MKEHPKIKLGVVVLNWNGLADTIKCIDSLLKQTVKCRILVVDNKSEDNSVEYLQTNYPSITVFANSKNSGFAGGVNIGIKILMSEGYTHIALLNNDASVEPTWIEYLYKTMTDNPKSGIVTSKLVRDNGLLDSTGDFYTSWGLAFPRGRDEVDASKSKTPEAVFAASGGASLYRSKMLKNIGLFDEDFFAYYEDVDISFRAQLAGWQVMYDPKAIAHHSVGASSGKVKGLTTYMTLKNLPWLLIKNVPLKLLPTVLPRFIVAYIALVISALLRRQFLPVAKGLSVSLLLMPKKLDERYKISKLTKVDSSYIKSMLVYDLPPNAHKLRKLRSLLKPHRT